MEYKYIENLNLFLLKDNEDLEIKMESLKPGDIVEYHGTSNKDVMILEAIKVETNTCQKLPCHLAYMSCFSNSSVCRNINLKLIDKIEPKPKALTLNNAKEKLCIPDVCIYFSNCNEAEFCLIKYLFYDKDRV